MTDDDLDDNGCFIAEWHDCPGQLHGVVIDQERRWEETTLVWRFWFPAGWHPIDMMAVRYCPWCMQALGHDEPPAPIERVYLSAADRFTVRHVCVAHPDDEYTIVRIRGKRWGIDFLDADRVRLRTLWIVGCPFCGATLETIENRVGV